MKRAEISVIVPAYNAENYIVDCLSSIQNQSFPSFEILVIDDGSTDGTTECVKAIADQDDRVRLIRQSNTGVSAARNHGIESSRGQFIAFVDADDLVKPDFLLHLHHAVQKADMAVIGVENIGPNHERSIRRIMEPQRLTNSEDSFSLIHTFMTGIWDFPNWNKLYRKSIIDQHKISFVEGLSMGEDKLFNIQYLLHSHSVNASPELGYGYRMRPESVYRSASPKSRWLEHCKAMRATENMLIRVLPNHFHELTPSLISSPTIHQALPDLLQGLKNNKTEPKPRRKTLRALLNHAHRSWLNPKRVALSPLIRPLFFLYHLGCRWPLRLDFYRRIS